MLKTKANIRDLIINGKLEQANNAGLEYARHCGLVEIMNEFTKLGSRITAHHQQWHGGTISYDEYSRHHARIVHDLTAWLERLPDNPAPSGKKVKLLDEATFKKRLFYALLFTKIIVLARLAYHWSTGGFNNDQFQGTAALLAPAFAAYISVMLADYLQQHHNGDVSPRYLSGPLLVFSYWLFPLYAILLILFLEMKVKGVFSFAQMNLWLALVESVLGGYIGRIVFSFFKE